MSTKGGPFPVNELHRRRPQDPPPIGAQSKTQVDVIVSEGHAFVEPPSSAKRVCANHHASSGHARDVLFKNSPAEIAATAALGAVTGMTRNPPQAQDDTRMLNRAIWVIERRA